jgi:AcrR family transcriptional regulator
MLAEADEGRGLSVDQVAQRAHVSRATVYRHFPGRNALARAAAGPDARGLGPRDQIIEAALAVILHRGLHVTTLREVADRAGVSLSGLHWHFKNKLELFAGVADYMRVLPTIAEEASHADDADLEEQLTRIADVALATFRERPGLVRIIFCDTMAYPQVAHLFMTQVTGRALPLLSGLFEAHVRRGTARPGPAAARAQAFMSTILMYVMLSPLLGDLLPDEQTCVREYVQIFVRGINTQPAVPNQTGETNSRC